ncbi:copper resistance CopC family protein [Serinibacter arcticus]|uniref:Copper resistance protein CopC n=1 Tax=Serinibacter arcticus TaxID=1655435 RepID=A0A4Z1E7K6_9MICO|nr:copper resistance CopC family protein [Serinibacter arcticus]TGO05657.1 Copper resistance protein CopC [Serinibacter arcticus]
MPAPSAARTRVAAVLATAATLVALPLVPAAAHDTLVSSAPAAQEQLATAPPEVTLTFSADVIEVGSAVLVTDAESGASGTDHAAGLTIEGRDVVVPLDALEDGHYDVRWRVVSSDGHPISGVIPFSVGDAGARPEAVVPPGDGAEVDPGSAPSTGSDAEGAAVPDAPSTAGPWRTLGVAVAGALGAAALFALTWWWRRRPHRTRS